MSEGKNHSSGFLRPALKKIGLFFTRNWALKLISLLLAILIWAGLISQDESLTRDKLFTGVSVTVSGEESLINSKGLIVVSGLEGESLSVDLYVEVPQSSYKAVSASSYNPRIDLTRLTGAGEQTLKIQTSSTSSTGSVTQVVPDSVTVVVEEYVTNYRVPVSVEFTKDFPTGMGSTAPSADPSTVSVSGPKSLVDRVSRIVVNYDPSSLSGRSGSIRSALPYHFEDENGEIIESDLLKVTSIGTVLRSITVSLTVYPLSELSLSGEELIYGTPASGYRVESVSLSPESLTVGGDSDALSRIRQLFTEGAVSVEGLSESFTQTIKIKKPSDISFISADSVTLTVTIAPAQSSRVFAGVKVESGGLPSTLKISSIPKSVNVEVTGPSNPLKGLKSGQLSVSVNLAGITEPGTYTLPLTVSLNNNDGQEYSVSTDPAEITVVIVSK